MPADADAPTNAAEQVAAELRRKVISGEISEGEALPPEIEHAALLGVSRPTLRQAIHILETEHLLYKVRGRNGATRVSRPSISTAGRYLNDLLVFRGATADDVHLARLMIEPNAVADITGKLGSDEIESLRDLVARARAEPDLERAYELAQEFHMRLVEKTGNRSILLLSRLVMTLVPHLGSNRSGHRPGRSIEEQLAATHVDHDRLIDLLETGAAQDAAAHWRAHLDAERSESAGSEAASAKLAPR